MTHNDDIVETPAYILSVFEDSPIPISIYDRDGVQVALTLPMGECGT